MVNLSFGAWINDKADTTPKDSPRKQMMATDWEPFEISVVPVPAVAEFKTKFNARFRYVPDHNGIKGYTGVYAIAYATKKLGKFDRKALAASLHGMTISPKDEPGILIETTWDAKGDIDRVSYIAEVVNGKQTITGELPKLGK